MSVIHGLSQAGTALRQLMQASHVGKIVVNAKPQAGLEPLTMVHVKLAHSCCQ